MIFPLTIHSVTGHKGNRLGEIPSTGRTFGWESRFQTAISSNKRYHGLSVE
jgi:hypothetical protein